MDLDQLLQPEDGSKKKPTKKPVDESTKNRLDSLKEMMKADPIQLDTATLMPSVGDFPSASMAKYIDYVEEKKNHREFAIQAINNIIETYVKFELPPRLKDLKQKDIIKYARLLLLVQISEDNVIKLQESIDGGDMSKEMFDSVNKAQKELRDNMEAEEKHLDKCDKYWRDYAENYGLQNAEEEIVQAQEVKDESKTTTIIDMSKLAELIQENLKKEKEKNKNQE